MTAVTKSFGQKIGAAYTKAQDIVEQDGVDMALKIVVPVVTFIGVGALAANGMADVLGASPETLNVITGPVIGITAAGAGAVGAGIATPLTILAKSVVIATAQTIAEGLGLIGQEA